MTPLDVITTLLDSLPDRERKQVAKRLQLSVCAHAGHNYRPAGIEIRWLFPPRVKLVCTKCGRKMNA